MKIAFQHIASNSYPLHPVEYKTARGITDEANELAVVLDYFIQRLDVDAFIRNDRCDPSRPPTALRVKNVRTAGWRSAGNMTA